MRAYAIETGLRGLSDLIHSEYDPTYTTDKGVLLAGAGGVRVVPARAVVAKVLLGAATVTAGAVVGTGNGAPGVVTADAGAPEGLWQVVIVEPGANAGAFQVFRPDGTLDGAGVVGVAYNGGINFTVADGGVDFIAGDRFPVTVDYANAPGKFVRWDPAGVNGSQTVAGVACFEAVAEENVDGEITVLARGPAILRRENIVFHEGVTNDQKAAAYAALEALGLQCRQTG
ncbi:MAG TPA: head decoration protein [Brevundimonas sp.]|nr:head decoration protein [Brevundimonas sp.]